MRRTISDALISIGALAALLVTLIAFDDRVRDVVSLRFSTGASADLVGAGTQIRDIGAVLLDVARDQSMQHAPLMMFVLAATVLVMFMVRT